MKDQAMYVGDAASVGIVLGTLAQWLPPIAAGLTIVWMIIRIMESQVFCTAYKSITGKPTPWSKTNDQTDTGTLDAGRGHEEGNSSLDSRK